MEKKGLTSTITIGIFLLLSIFFVARLIPFNMHDQLEAYKESLKESENAKAEGEMIIIIGGLAAVGALGIILVGYLFSTLIIINSGISLIFSIKNRKSNVLWIKIINLIYDIILSLLIIFAVYKIVMFRSGLG